MAKHNRWMRRERRRKVYRELAIALVPILAVWALLWFARE
jgi:hypothetical protein